MQEIYRCDSYSQYMIRKQIYNFNSPVALISSSNSSIAIMRKFQFKLLETYLIDYYILGDISNRQQAQLIHTLLGSEQLIQVLSATLLHSFLFSLNQLSSYPST